MLTLENALDRLRADGWSEPVWGHVVPQMGIAPPPGRFVGQCGRCLRFVQAGRVDLGFRQRIWLCSECAGPKPPVVVLK